VEGIHLPAAGSHDLLEGTQAARQSLVVVLRLVEILQAETLEVRLDQGSLVAVETQVHQGNQVLLFLRQGLAIRFLLLFLRVALYPVLRMLRRGSQRREQSVRVVLRDQQVVVHPSSRTPL
jgi:hypothetical protein